MPPQRDVYKRQQLHQLVEEYLALGLAPEKLIGFSALNEGELSARFFGLLKGGKP